MSEVTNETLEMSSKIAKHFTIDKEGKPTINEHVLVDVAPEGITGESIAKHLKFRDDFVIAATHAGSMAAADAAKKHKNIEEVSFSFPLGGKDLFNLDWKRSKEVPDGIGKDAGTKTVYGHTTRGIHQTATKGSSGQMKAVLAAVSDHARELLG